MPIFKALVLQALYNLPDDALEYQHRLSFMRLVGLGLEVVLDPDNTASTVWADSACRSKETEAKLAARGMTSHIHWRGSRGKLLTPRQEAVNKTRSKLRARAKSKPCKRDHPLKQQPSAENRDCSRWPEAA